MGDGDGGVKIWQVGDGGLSVVVTRLGILLTLEPVTTMKFCILSVFVSCLVSAAACDVLISRVCDRPEACLSLPDALKLLIQDHSLRIMVSFAVLLRAVP